MKTTQPMMAAYIRMWPREIYNLKDGNKPLESVREKLRQKSGIYILYKSTGEPLSRGQSAESLGQNSQTCYESKFQALLLVDTFLGLHLE